MLLGRSACTHGAALAGGRGLCHAAARAAHGAPDCVHVCDENVKPHDGEQLDQRNLLAALRRRAASVSARPGRAPVGCAWAALSSSRNQCNCSMKQCVLIQSADANEQQHFHTKQLALRHMRTDGQRETCLSALSTSWILPPPDGKGHVDALFAGSQTRGMQDRCTGNPPPGARAILWKVGLPQPASSSDTSLRIANALTPSSASSCRGGSQMRLLRRGPRPPGARARGARRSDRLRPAAGLCPGGGAPPLSRPSQDRPAGRPEAGQGPGRR